MPVKMMKPRIQCLRPTIKAQATAPGATPRMRGRKWMDRRARFLSEHPLCAHCEAEGRAGAAVILDHRVPLAEGGADAESNYQGLCAHHNEIKTAEDIRRISKAR